MKDSSKKLAVVAKKAMMYFSLKKAEEIELYLKNI